MLESAAAEAEVETDRETGGLDKVVECDDEGGGEQVEGVENGNDHKSKIGYHCAVSDSAQANKFF